MSRALMGLGMAIGLTAVLNIAAHANPPCFKEKRTFALADDFVSWTLSAAPCFEMHSGTSLVLHADFRF